MTSRTSRSKAGSVRGNGVVKRRRQRPHLARIAEDLAVPVCPGFFATLVEQLARNLAMDFAAVGDFADDGQAHVTVAARGRTAQELIWPVAETAAGQLTKGRPCRIRSGVRRQFPDDRWLAEQAVESFVGVPLADKTGRCRGFLAVGDRRPPRAPVPGAH